MKLAPGLTLVALAAVAAAVTGAAQEEPTIEFCETALEQRPESQTVKDLLEELRAAS